MEATGLVEAMYYDQEFGPIKFIGKRKDGVPRKAYMDPKGFMEIQNEAAKLPRKAYMDSKVFVTIIMPYRPMSGPIIEVIDDERLLSKGKGSSYNYHIQNENAADCGKD